MPTTPKAAQGPIELLNPGPRGKAAKGDPKDDSFANTLAAQTAGIDADGSIEDTTSGPATTIARNRSRGAAAAKSTEAAVATVDTTVVAGVDAPGMALSASALPAASAGVSTAGAAPADGATPDARSPMAAGARATFDDRPQRAGVAEPSGATTTTGPLPVDGQDPKTALQAPRAAQPGSGDAAAAAALATSEARGGSVPGASLTPEAPPAGPPKPAADQPPGTGPAMTSLARPDPGAASKAQANPVGSENPKSTVPIGAAGATVTVESSATRPAAGTTDTRLSASGPGTGPSMPPAAPATGASPSSAAADGPTAGDAGAVVDVNTPASARSAAKATAGGTPASVAAAAAIQASGVGEARAPTVSTPASEARTISEAGRAVAAGSARPSRSGEAGGAASKALAKGFTNATTEPAESARATSATGTSGTLSPSTGPAAGPVTTSSGPGEPGPSALESLQRDAGAGPVETASDVHASARAEDPLGQPIDLTADPDELRAQLGDRVAMAVSRGVERAEVQVRPEGMGPIRIELTMQGNEAHVQFTAAHADTRSMLADSTDALRGMLAERGIQLGSATVGQEGGRPAPDQQRTPQGTLGWIATRSTEIGPESTNGAHPVSSGRSGTTGVDLFA